MVIFIFIWLLFAVSFCRDFHKTLIVYLPVSVLLITGFAIKYSSPVISVETALNFQILAMAYQRHMLNLHNFPQRKAFRLMFVVLILSFVFTHVNYTQAFTNVLGSFLPLWVVVVFFKEFSIERDFRLFHKAMLAVSTTFIVYGFLEYALQFNPILSSVKDFIENEGSGLAIFLTKEDNIRFGSIRCQSFFMHSIAYGTYCVIFTLYYLYTLKECKLSSSMRLLTIVTIPLLFFGMITSGSRSPMVGLVIGLSCFLNMRMLKKSAGLLVLLFVLAIVAYQLGLLNTFTALVSSLADAKGDTVGGSSIDLRLLQIQTCFMAISSNPLIGLGARGGEYAYYTLKLYDLAGLESCWFQLLITQGLLGCAAQLYLFYSLYKYSKRKDRQYSFETSLVFAFFVVNTMTSIPGVGNEKLMFILFVMVLYTKYKEQFRLKNAKR